MTTVLLPRILEKLRKLQSQVCTGGSVDAEMQQRAMAMSETVLVVQEAVSKMHTAATGTGAPAAAGGAKQSTK